MSSLQKRLTAAALAVAVLGSLPDRGSAQERNGHAAGHALALSAGSATVGTNPSAPITRLPSTLDLYPSQDRAALAAFASIAPIALHEWSGVIVERDGQYAFTLPVTSGLKDSVSIVAAIPKSFRIVALYHTHPCRPGSDRFSHGDVQMAVREKLQSYIRACGERVYVLNPTQLTNDDRRRLHDMQRLFAGKELRERAGRDRARGNPPSPQYSPVVVR